MKTHMLIGFSVIIFGVLMWGFNPTMGALSIIGGLSWVIGVFLSVAITNVHMFITAVHIWWNHE
jgi:hypothetical protein